MPEDLVLPITVARELDLERRAGETTCQYAVDTTYQDTSRRAIYCQVSRDHYPVAENPQVATAFCCGDYTTCPVFQKTLEGGEAIAKWRAEMEQRKQDRITRRQIANGTRVDDRGLERELRERGEVE